MFTPEKKIAEELEVKPGGDVGVFLEASIGDTVVHCQEGDSLMGFLLYWLHCSAAARTSGLGSQKDAMGYSLFYGEYENVQDGNPWDVRSRGPIVGISGVSGSDPMEITLGMSQGTGIDAGYEDVFTYGTEAGKSVGEDMNGVIIFKANGNPDLNAWFSKDQVTWTNEDPAKVEVPVSSTGNEDISNALAIPVFSASSRQGFEDREFEVAKMGVGLDDTPNEGGEPHLYRPVRPGGGTNQLQYNPLTINEPVINVNQQISTIEITRELANNSGADINLGEIGLWVTDVGAKDMGYGDRAMAENYMLISRDTIDIKVPDNETLSFSYKIRTSCDTDGGIMTNFNEMLYRHIASTTRVARDINNTDQNDGPSRHTFKSRSFGGSLSNIKGVMLGTSDETVDEGNVNMGNRIPLGQQDGELYRVGSYISDFNYNSGTGKSYFDLVSFFENRGSTSIDVNELGWITGGPSGNVLVARTLTGSTETISPGDLVEARFRVSLQP